MDQYERVETDVRVWYHLWDLDISWWQFEAFDYVNRYSHCNRFEYFWISNLKTHKKKLCFIVRRYRIWKPYADHENYSPTKDGTKTPEDNGVPIAGIVWLGTR